MGTRGLQSPLLWQGGSCRADCLPRPAEWGGTRAVSLPDPVGGLGCLCVLPDWELARVGSLAVTPQACTKPFLFFCWAVLGDQCALCFYTQRHPYRQPVVRDVWDP